MKFKLVSGGETLYFDGDDAGYRFNHQGLLVVTDGRGKQFTYSPGAWTRIEEPEPESGAISF